MSPTIRVDDDVYAELKLHAEPFVDTPNSVLRRLLQLDPVPAAGAEGFDAGVVEQGAPSEAPATRTNGAAKPRHSQAARAASKKPRVKKTRAPRGSLLPETEYDLPLLESLVEAGGAAPSKDVIRAVGEKIGDRLTEVDREELRSGVIRWANRVQFVRLRLIQDGLLIKDPGRGIWAITDAGRARLDEAKSTMGGSA